MKMLYSKTIAFSLLKKSFVILCTLIMMLTMIPSVFAAYGPSSADLKEIGSQIEYPKDKEYLDDYAYGTIIAPKGHSVYCYGSADRKGSQYTVLDGEEVVVLAKRKDMLCVIIPSQRRGRWVREEYVDVYSGSTGMSHSSTSTFRPFSARHRATVHPQMPAPPTITSTFCMNGDYTIFLRFVRSPMKRGTACDAQQPDQWSCWASPCHGTKAGT